jgi:Tfp pilus assembly protein PilO
MLNSLKEKIKTYLNKFLAIVVVFAAITISFKWMLSPHLQNLHAASRYSRIVTIKQNRIDLLQKEIKSSKQKLTKLENQYNDLQSGFFQPKQAIDFFTKLPKIAQDNNCILLSQASLEDSPKNINSKLITPRKTALVIQAHYDDFIKFLNQLGSLPHKVTIGEIEVASQSENARKLVYGLTLVIYVLEDEG